MNKAFVRDAEPTVERCPRCGSIGQPVGSTTLDAFVRPEERSQLGETACFCATETCPVAYFDAFERDVTIRQLVKPVYPKDPDAPLCSCFGVTCEEIDADVRAGVATRTRALIERAKSPEARCPLMAANGQSCVPAVQRYFMKCRQR
jgi:CopZ-like zinc binding protein